jgi:hypothetical protein
MAPTTIRRSVGEQRTVDPVVRRGSRLPGAVVALAIAASVAIVTWPVFGSFFAFGIPAATMLGWWLGPAVRSDEPIDGPVIVMALLSIPLAEAIWIVATPSATTSVTAVLFVGIYGLMYIGIPMLFVTVPCAIAWAKVVRRLASSEKHG